MRSQRETDAGFSAEEKNENVYFTILVIHSKTPEINSNGLTLVLRGEKLEQLWGGGGGGLHCQLISV